MTDVLAGRVTMMFGPAATVLPAVKEGRLRALAVTSPSRFPNAPGIPTVAESGYPGFEVTGWIGLVAPAGTPTAVVRKLQSEATKALASPDVQARLGGLGLEPIGSTPEAFDAAIVAGGLKWSKLIAESAIRADQ
jgi:tripartite-type tricarboxylate transporter receptor subunit TctC